MPEPYLHIEGVEHEYSSGGATYWALGGVSLDVRAGEFVSLIGPSGCGKSTLLSAVAGLTRPTRGDVVLDGRAITGPGVDRGVVFQDHALLPWLTALENIVFALDCVRPSEPARLKREIALRYLDLVRLSHARDRRPGQLSGGMKQRVGIARAFAINPKVLLLDEPFGALDALTRGELQTELLRIWEAEMKTVLMVTHDVDEAIYLSDRIVVMTHGPGARIRAVLDVDFPRPRDKEALMEDREYYRLRSTLLHMLAEEMAA